MMTKLRAATTLNMPTLSAIQIPGDTYDQMRETLRVIGGAIVDGSRYLPIRNRAAALASLTRVPKDYFSQAKHIYDDFVKRWRYVKDPVGRELIAQSPKQVFNLVMGGTSSAPGAGFGRGVGDCDDACVAIGAQLMAIGIPVRVCCIAPPNAPPGRLMSHVFAQGLIPGFGWVTVDPVVHPKHGFGYTPPYSRFACFDLNGELLEKKGNYVELHGYESMEDQKMETLPSVNKWQDFAGFGDVVDEGYDLPDFRKVGIAGFGCYAEQQGMMDCGDLGMGLAAEVDTDARGLAWAPIMELAPKDYDFIRATGAPYHGMLGLGDDGQARYWDQNLGFFKKLFKKAKKAFKKVKKKVRGVVRKVAKKAKSIAKKVLKKLPGGKYLLKLGQKLWKISKKLVKPLMKYVGPLATKLAPISALIPGVGPAVAAGLAMTGRIAKLMKKYKAVVKGKAGKVGKIKFKSDRHAKAFQKALKRAAKKQKPMTPQQARAIQARKRGRGRTPLGRRRRARPGRRARPTIAPRGMVPARRRRPRRRPTGGQLLRRR